MAALTRLAIAYCLGRGSLCLVSRSYTLQINQPRAMEPYIHYQWRRLCQYLPRTRPPVLYAGSIRKPAPAGSQGQWRLRVGCRHFQVATRLLYPDGLSGGVRLTSAPLELSGAEAIASLWADRGSLVGARGSSIRSGQINLGRFQWEDAAMIGQWLQTLTGASSELGEGLTVRRDGSTVPTLFFTHEAVSKLLAAVSDTWHAQAPCLRHKFALPISANLAEKLLKASRRRPAINAEELMANPNVPVLRSKPERRRSVPSLPAA